MNRSVLILSGFNIRAVIAFCRWAYEHHITFYIVARGTSDPIFLTDFAKNVYLIRENESLLIEDFCSWIHRIRNQHSYDEVLILPSSEFLNRFMLRNHSQIVSSGGVVPLVNKDLYEQISDKYSFGKLCLSAGIPVPEEYQSIPNEFPFVAKPKNYASIQKRQLKPYLIYCEADLINFLQEEIIEDYYFQQYIQGKSLYLFASINKHGESVLFSQENLIQQVKGGSVILARANDFYKKMDAEIYMRLLKSLSFQGLVMLEVRYHEESQKYFMIEANPRLWGPIQFVVDNGIDIFGYLLRDYGFDVNQNIKNIKHAKFYFWSGGIPDNGDVVFHNYSPDQFFIEFNSIIQNNIFLREDTMALFHHELPTPINM